MPLKINVKPGEKFVVNGAVMVAGKKGASLVLQNEATILLGKDIMQEEDANTPAKRIYFTILLMYLDQDESDQYRGVFLELVESFLEATTFKEVRMTLLNIVQDVNEKRFYRALKTCKALMTYEAEILKIGAPEAVGS
ncbi:MAG: flagellar biosynthesis repressor FlbT [Nisaea sp.]|jgi:flagellar protein FlbT|uniref:flagellar biosynthesis repressor FlbT n=1 Tax=Nisaea sp. TaxID=2024842 RepID=UPI001B090500|nr:flagellar biosynthesis repressor FlbT [Nisaea sp.]MBO6559996.1 flagellar biosynthesis repressor FlbT [Nisaea sp.]